ncbi:MAG: hypothetical protein C3F11_05955 [Methylocystaceae bacterium]|nr:MAG: hypothetical protein C3F11_05955 [Methylocystaceae bacterium]
MNVLHVIPSVSKVHGGPTHALTMMERSLSALGVAVTTLTTDDDGPGRRLSSASRPHSVDGAMRLYARKWSEFYKFSPGLLTWLLRHVRDFDVIHIHALFSFSSVAAAFAARARGVPYVVRPLGTLNEYGVKRRRPWLKTASFRLIESRILTHAAAVHFTSQGEWDEAKSLGVPSRGVVIPLGVDGAEVTEQCKPPIEVEAGQKIVLFLSRLDPKKNVEGLLKAFGSVRQSHSNAVLVIAGDGPAEYVRSLKSLAEAEGIAEATTWTGHVEGPQKWSTFAAADVFVLPSLSENFGIAAVEAMIAGRACVIGRGVAIAEEIAGAGAGLVTEPDPPSIAHALKSLLDEETLRREMGARGRELAEREYASSAMAKRLVELYCRIARPVEPARQSKPTSDAVAALSEPSRPSGEAKEQ